MMAADFLLSEIQKREEFVNRMVNMSPEGVEMKAIEDMTAAEISLEFAREVAGYPNANALPGYEPRIADGSGVMLPDYVNDWNATILAVEAKGWTFQIMSGPVIHRDATVRADGKAFYGHGEFHEPCAIALCRAAIKCARGDELEAGAFV